MEAVRYRLDEAGWRDLVDRAGQQGVRGQIVGGHGSGKTTLLAELERRLCATGILTLRIELHDWARALPSHPNARDAVILCDGAEQLSAIDAMRLRWRARGARGLIVTAHRAGSWGRVLHHCETSPGLLRDVVAALGITMPADEAAALYSRHRGDIRLALRDLYCSLD